MTDHDIRTSSDLVFGSKDPSPSVVLACCGALGAMPSTQTAAAVAELLEVWVYFDGSYAVETEILKTSHQAVPCSCYFCEKDPHPAVRAGAANALAEMGGTQAP